MGKLALVQTNEMLKAGVPKEIRTPATTLRGMRFCSKAAVYLQTIQNSVLRISAYLRMIYAHMLALVQTIVLKPKNHFVSITKMVGAILFLFLLPACTDCMVLYDALGKNPTHNICNKDKWEKYPDANEKENQ